MRPEDYKELIKIAKDSVKDEDEPFKTNAFNIILNSLIQEKYKIREPEKIKKNGTEESKLGAKIELLDEFKNLPHTTSPMLAASNILDASKQPLTIKEVTEIMKKYCGIIRPTNYMSGALNDLFKRGKIRKFKLENKTVFSKI